MAGTFKFELVTPERMALSQDVGQVVVSGGGGRVHGAARPRARHLGAAPGHDRGDAPGCRQDERIYVRGGFAEMDGDRLTVLAERAIGVDR